MSPDDRSELHFRLGTCNTAWRWGSPRSPSASGRCRCCSTRSSSSSPSTITSATIALRAPRGIMFDRHGKVLVQNRDALNISLVREQTRNLDQSIRMLAAVMGVEERLVREVVDRNRTLPRATGRSGSCTTRRWRRWPRIRPAGSSSSDVHARAGPDARVSRTGDRRRTCSATSARSPRRSSGGPSIEGMSPGALHRTGRHRADLQQAASWATTARGS